MQTVACPTCDHALAPGARFCAFCGSEVRPYTQESTIEVPPERLLLESLRRATLGEYEIREELGRGGMAVVYLARELRLNKKVAIKVLSPHLQMVPGMAARFLREAQTAAGMEHPNIIPIYAYRETTEFAFFTMRYVEGASLSAVAKQVGQFPVEIVRALLSDIGGALAFAHTFGVLHRDVKPGNVLLGRDGSVVVTDFGIAKQATGQSLTMTGQLLGTPAYMSPEQCRGTDLSLASDQYSLGVMAFELLTGRGPFLSASAGELMAQHLMAPAPDVLRFRPDCPHDLAETVMRMLAKEPAARFPSIDDALISGRAFPVLPNDPARKQLRQWASSPVHAISLANTPVSPWVRSDATPGGAAPVAPEPVVSAPALTPVPASPTPVSLPPVSLPPVSLPPVSLPPVSQRPMSATSVSSPASSAPAPSTPVSAPTPSTPPVSTPSKSVPARSAPRVSPATSVADTLRATLKRIQAAPLVTSVRTARWMLPALGTAGAMLAIVAIIYVTRDTGSGDKEKVIVPPPPVLRSGTLSVSQLPAGGVAYVDGERMNGARFELKEGAHNLRLEAPGYAVADTQVQVASGGTTTIVFANAPIVEPPKPTLGILAVTGLPRGGSISVDGRRITGSRAELGAGQRRVRLQAPGFAPVDTVLAIVANETRTLAFASVRVEAGPTKPQPPAGKGVLMLRVWPFAKVFVDGVVASDDGRLVMSLPEGRHALKFENTGFVTFDTVVTISRADTIRRSFTLQPRTP